MKIAQHTTQGCLFFILAAFLLPLSSAAPPDPVEIVKKSLERDRMNLERAKDYTFVQHIVTRQFDRKGVPRSKESQTNDVLILDGTFYSRRIAKDDRPLSPADARKEDEKYRKTREKRLNESDAERRKRLEKETRARAESRRFLQEIPAAYVLRLAGQETVDGHPAWIIDADPRPGYRPRLPRSDILPKVRGRLWIEQRDYQWVKVEAQTLDTVSFGWLLARLAPGARLNFEQKAIAPELWMPTHVAIRADLRVALLKHLNGDVDITFRDYRKFQTDSRIVSVSEDEDPPKR